MATKIKNNTSWILNLDNKKIKPSEITEISKDDLLLLQTIYGDKIEILDNKINIDLKNVENENITLKEKIAKLEAEKSNVIAKEEPVIVKKEKSQERLDMEAEAKVLGIKTAHLMGDETLSNKILEIKTAPEQTA